MTSHIPVIKFALGSGRREALKKLYVSNISCFPIFRVTENISLAWLYVYLIKIILSHILLSLKMKLNVLKVPHDDDIIKYKHNF